MSNSKIQERLKKLREQSSNKFAHLWKAPKDGKVRVRICPNPHSDEEGFPFLEYHYHYNITSNNRPVVCQEKTFGGECEICNMVKELWKGDKEDQKLARQYGAKPRIHTPVLVRGEEGEGIRWYSHGTQVYEAILEIMADPDYGDITDIKAGHDLTLTVTPPSGENRFPSTSVVPKPKQNPLAPTKEEAKKLLAEVPVFEDHVTIDTPEEISALLAKLVGEDEPDSSSSSDDENTGTVWDEDDDDDDDDL